MNKDVVVSLSGLHSIDDGGDPVELMIPGRYYLKNGKHYIVYEDVPEEGGETFKNVIKVAKDRVELQKKGSLNTNLTFETGKTVQNYYCTPYGDVAFESVTEKIDVRQADTSLHVEIRYSLKMNKQPLDDCLLKLTVREAGGRFS